MNFLKKGPEIKLSELKPSKIKVPRFVEDVYYDLKDRHLLPVAVILLVAIFAVPIAISDSGSEEEGGSPGKASISAEGDSETVGALVSEATPGLRKYEKRLDERSAENPFKQKYAPLPEPKSGAGGESSGGSAGGSEESSESSFSFSPSGSGGEGGSGSTHPADKGTYFSYAIDVRITGGSGDKKKTTVRKNLPTLTMLPSRETPAIVYMGSTKDGKKAVMTVSSDVKSIFGDAKCVLGSETCQMLVMETGLPATFVYGGAEKTYTIELIKIELVESDELNKAALGNPKKQGKGKSKNRPLSGVELLP